MRIDREQTISSERVVSQVGDWIMLESGKLIPGRWPVGEMAPVIFDNRYKCYIPVFKGDKAGAPIKRADETAPAVGKRKLPITRPVMAFTYGNNIFFRVGKKIAGDSARSFYIDLTPVLVEMGHNDSGNSYHFLRIIEFKPYMGALLYSRGNIGECFVIRFKVLTPLLDLTIHDGVPYKQYSYEYAVDIINTEDEDLPFDVMDVQLGAPGRPAGEYNRRWTKDNAELMGYGYCWCPPDLYGGHLLAGPSGNEGVVGGGPTTFIDDYSFTTPFAAAACTNESGEPWGAAPMPFSLTLTSSTQAVNTEIEGGTWILDNGILRRWFNPIGMGLWLVDKNSELLDNLRWEIKIAAWVKYKFNYRTSFSHEVSGGEAACGPCFGEGWFYCPSFSEMADLYYGENGPPAPFNSEFIVPVLFSKSRDAAMIRDDVQGLEGLTWAYDNGVVIYQNPSFVNVVLPYKDGGTEWIKNEWADYEGEPPYEGRLPWEWGISYSPKTTYRPGRYVRAWPVYEAVTGVLSGFMVNYEQLNEGDESTKIEQYVCSPSATVHIVDADREQSEDVIQDQQHAGGGVVERHACRISPGPTWSVPTEGNRSIYIINGELYDYNRALPDDPDGFFPLGKASRELILSRLMLGLSKTPVLDSELTNDVGDVSLTGKYTGFVDLESGEAYDLCSDFGILPSSFWRRR